MKQWTVLGLYEHDWQSYCEHIEAKDDLQAMAIIGSRNPSVTIIGAIEGTHILFTPGDDNGLAVMGEDMADLLEGEGE